MKADREQRKRIIVGISGASGVIYGIRLLEILRDLDIETHLVMSRAAQITLAMETDFKVADVEALAACVHSNKDIGASCSSGSFRTLGMIVAPCSIKTLSEIATGVTSGLLSRAADVTLKERRRLVLMLRETPLHIGHIRSMAQATEAGAIICPPSRPSMPVRRRWTRWSIIPWPASSICSISIPGSHIDGAGGALPSLTLDVKMSR